MQSAIPAYTRTAEQHARRMFQVLRKRMWAVLTVLVIVVTAVVVRTFLMTPIFQAGALLLIEREEPKILDFEEVVSLDTSGNDFYNTQFRILLSRSLARSVIEDLDLKNRPGFRSTRPTAAAWTEAEMGAAIDRFLRALQVQPVENSRLTWVRFRSPDAKLSADVANRVTENYIRQDLDRRYVTSQAAVDWLNDRLTALKEKVKGSETALQQFQEDQTVVSFEERKTIVSQKLQEMNEAYSKTRTERLKAEAVLDEIRKLGKDSPDFDTLPTVIKNPLIQGLKTRASTLKADREKLLEKLGEKHPDIVKLNSELAQLDVEIRGEIRRIIESTETEYRILTSQEATLQRALDQQKQEAAGLNRNLIRYSELARNVESDRIVLENLLNRSKETSISVDLKSSNIRVVDPAEIPRFPIKPRRLFDIQIGVILGLLLGVLGALFLEAVDDRMRTPDELKQIVSEPVVGTIPLWTQRRGASGIVPADAAQQEPLAEAFRMLRVRVWSRITEKDDKALLITGSAPGCGKTFVTSNLAVFLALDQKKTLLIDGDFRKPSLHKVFGIRPERGISDYLADRDVDPRNILCRFPQWPHLFLIPGGKGVPNPAELLGGRKFQRFLDSVRKEFDVILIDSPPLLAVADPSVLVHRIETVLLVAESGRTTARELSQCSEILNQGKPRLWGIVMNKIKRQDFRYPYYGYDYHASTQGEKKWN